MGVHKSHDDVLKRLKRAHGHLHKIMDMMEDGRPCLDVAQQMAAVEAAVHKAKQTYIRDHIDHCMEQALKEDQDTEAALLEFKAISKYL